MSQKEIKPRVSAVERRREKTIAEADRLAALLSAAPPETDQHLSPPAYIKDARLAPALAMWRELEKSLLGTGRLSTVDRSTFAALCYWHSEWITAIDDIQDRGYSFMVRAISGGERPWRNPSVERRDTAWDQILKLSERFGLTPLDRIVLNKGKQYQSGDDELPLPAPRSSDVPAAEVKLDRWTNLLQ